MRKAPHLIHNLAVFQFRNAT